MAKRELNAGSNIMATCNIYGKYEKPVQGGLALTPAMVKQMTDRGLSVSTPNIGQIQENGPSDGTLEPQYRRGMDMNTAWELSHNVSKGLIHAHKRDKKIFG